MEITLNLNTDQIKQIMKETFEEIKKGIVGIDTDNVSGEEFKEKIIKVIDEVAL